MLKSGSRGATRDHESLGLRRALVVVQVALSLVLVVGALLFVRSFNNLLAAPLGFQQKNVLGVDVLLPGAAARAGSGHGVPARRGGAAARAAGRGERRRDERRAAERQYHEERRVARWGTARARGQSLFARVTPGYFDTLRMPLVAGRDITARDVVNTPDPSPWSNETFVRQVAGGKEPPRPPLLDRGGTQNRPSASTRSSAS